MMLADLHIHSTFSDGKLTIPELVDFYGTRGFGAIAITDHICEEGSWIGIASSYLKQTLTPATFPLYKEILRSEARRAWDHYRLILLPGFELSKNSISNNRSAHILGIGLMDSFDYVSADGEVLDLIRRVKAQGALAIAAHPVWTRKREKQTYHLWDRKAELAGHLDAWEVASGPHLFEEVWRTDLPKIATSDLHRPSQVNAWKTLFDCERHPEAILEAIRKQRLSFRYYQAEADERILPHGHSTRTLPLGGLPHPDASGNPLVDRAL
ncbi:MAG: PHP domain-containing protein [Oligoflexia bacterium]|nr:PHP domain-containing protein [Oligoflexia bacterium]